MNQDNLRLMRRAFAELIARDAEAFNICANEYQQSGAEAFPKQVGSGMTRTVPDHSLAMLLVEYRNRQGTKDDFLASEAGKGITTGDRFSGFEWNNAETILSYLKRAQRMEKEDPQFRRDVAFYSWAHEALGGFRND